MGMLKKPLFNLEREATAEALRTLGGNAARLVKGMPLR
jgi:hypothetical protein